MGRFFIVKIIMIFNIIFGHVSNVYENSGNSFQYINLGDVNNDGTINIQDVIIIVNIVLDLDYNSLADLNDDQSIDVLDIIQVVNIILYGPVSEDCIEEAYTTTGILTNLSEQVYNTDESINQFSIYSWTSDETDRILNGNGIPNHEVGTFPNPNCPNTISQQNVNHTFPLYPELISDNGDFSIGGPNATSAYALNSVKFDPATAGRCNNNGVCSLAQGQGQWNIEALGHETFNFGDDMNHAHVQPSGEYHYHGMPDLLLDFLNQGEERMTIVGWASDGFPIYARYIYSEACNNNTEIKVAESSWRLKEQPDINRPNYLTEISGGPNGGQTNLNIPIPMGAFTQDYEYVEGLGDLDECNGRIGVTPEFPDGIYYYVITDEFPFFTRCLKGYFETNGGGGGGGLIPGCDEVPPGLPCCGDGICGPGQNPNNCPEDCN